MSEIKERLQQAGEACMKAYIAWDGNQKDEKAREELQESIHELRKVTSRLEIELAISERDQMPQKKIPIPPHRAARGKAQEAEGDNPGNDDGQAENKGPKVQRKRSPRKSAGGNS